VSGKKRPFGLGQRRAHLPEAPALHDGHGPQGLFPARQLVQQPARRDAALQLVAAGLDLLAFAGDAEPCVQQPRIDVDPGFPHGPRHRPRHGARLDGQVDGVALERQGLVDPPGNGGKSGQRSQQRQHEQGGKEAAHVPDGSVERAAHDNFRACLIP
jgi:hypothetical protein